MYELNRICNLDLVEISGGNVREAPEIAVGRPDRVGRPGSARRRVAAPARPPGRAGATGVGGVEQDVRVDRNAHRVWSPVRVEDRLHRVTILEIDPRRHRLRAYWCYSPEISISETSTVAAIICPICAGGVVSCQVCGPPSYSTNRRLHATCNVWIRLDNSRRLSTSNTAMTDLIPNR